MKQLVVIRTPINDLGKNLKHTPSRWEMKKMHEGFYTLERDYVKIGYNVTESDIAININANRELVVLTLTKAELEYLIPCVEYVLSYHEGLKERDALYQLEQKLIEWSQR